MTVKLQQYIERIFDEREKALKIVAESQRDALALATTSLNRELSHLNDLRKEINEDRAQYLTRNEWNTGHNYLVEKVSGLDKRLTIIEGSKQGTGIAIGYVITAIAIITATMTAIIVKFGFPR